MHRTFPRRSLFPCLMLAALAASCSSSDRLTAPRTGLQVASRAGGNSLSPAIVLTPSSVFFAARLVFGFACLPVLGGSLTQTVSVTNGGTGTLRGLKVDDITYGAGATGWLGASLSGTTAPATLTLGVTCPKVGTFTASVPVTSPVASNSPQSVSVSLSVTSR